MKIAPLPATSRKIVYSTTDGRQQLHDILQDIYGDKAVIGFDRYGRVLGAIVPMEAVAMLAGHTEGVDDYTRDRIERAAQQLMKQTNDPRLVLSDMEAVDQKRRAVRKPVAPKVATQKRRTAEKIA